MTKEVKVSYCELDSHTVSVFEMCLERLGLNISYSKDVSHELGPTMNISLPSKNTLLEQQTEDTKRIADATEKIVTLLSTSTIANPDIAKLNK